MNNADFPGLSFSKSPANVAEENDLSLLAVGSGKVAVGSCSLIDWFSYR